MWRLSASRFLSGKSVDYDASQTVMGEETSTFLDEYDICKKKKKKGQNTKSFVNCTVTLECL